MKFELMIVTKVDEILKRFDHPDKLTHFEKGQFEMVMLGGMMIGRATQSRAGNGLLVSDRTSMHSFVMLSMSAWFYREWRLPHFRLGR